MTAAAGDPETVYAEQWEDANWVAEDGAGTRSGRGVRVTMDLMGVRALPMKDWLLAGTQSVTCQSVAARAAKYARRKDDYGQGRGTERVTLGR